VREAYFFARKLTGPRGKLIFRPGTLPSREGSLFVRQEAYRAAREAYFSARKLTEPREKLIFSPGSLPGRQGSLFFGQEAYRAAREAYFFARKLTEPRGKLIFRPGSLPSREGSLFFRSGTARRLLLSRHRQQRSTGQQSHRRESAAGDETGRDEPQLDAVGARGRAEAHEGAVHDHDGQGRLPPLGPADRKTEEIPLTLH
jgi:hypothetical protein